MSKTMSFILRLLSKKKKKIKKYLSTLEKRNKQINKRWQLGNGYMDFNGKSRSCHQSQPNTHHTYTPLRYTAYTHKHKYPYVTCTDFFFP